MSGTERDREIREIEHDLTNLQRRYATLDRAANRVRLASYVFIATLGALILAGAVVGKPAVSVTFAVVLIVVLLMAWSTARMYPERAGSIMSVGLRKVFGGLASNRLKLWQLSI